MRDKTKKKESTKGEKGCHQEGVSKDFDSGTNSCARQNKKKKDQQREKRVAFKNSLTPSQQKAADARRKEKSVSFESSLTPEQLCETKQKKG